MRTPAASPVPPVQKSQVDEPASYAEGPPGRPRDGSILSYSKNCPCGGLCPHCNGGPRIQTKLAISQQGDALEQEADQVAELVLSSPAPGATTRSPVRLQRFTSAAEPAATTVPTSVYRALASPGQPLMSGLCEDMEGRFGHDFSHVRVHTDSSAAQSARDVNAQAYTVGREVVFGAGRFTPDTHEGRRLLAHELTHVVQQGQNHRLQRKPAPGAANRVGLLGGMAEAPVLSFAELHARLQLIEQRLATMAQRYPLIESNTLRGKPRSQGELGHLGMAVEVARKQATDLGSQLMASPAQSQRVQQALQLLEWSDYDLSLLDQQYTKLRDNEAPSGSVDALRVRYAAVLENLFDPTGPALYETAQHHAERLPINIALDALRKQGEFRGPDGDLLPASEVIMAWTDDLRGRIDRLLKDQDQGKDVTHEAAFLEAAMRGIQLYTQRLVVFVQFIKNRPGITDTPLIGAMNRLGERVNKIKEAYDKHASKDLKARVDAMEADENINKFYKDLPLAMNVTRLIAKVGVTTMAAMATGGVGGLVSGGARTAATGLTLRGTATFAGTAVLEAVTFTALNSGGSALLFGGNISFGSLLKDFAWNLGLFGVLRGVSGVSGSMLRAAELQALSMPVNLTAGFPFAQGWGLMRFRIEQNRWPTKSELHQMTGESLFTLFMMAGIAVGAPSVQRWLSARKSATNLTLIRSEYGWRFDAMEAVRQDLGLRIRKAEEAAKGNDKAELNEAKLKEAILKDLKSLANKLENSSRELLETMTKDKRFNLGQMRDELDSLREQAPDLAAQLMADVLGVPSEALVRRAGPATYTYANGKTSALETALEQGYKVTKSMHPKSGLKTVTATAKDKPSLVFQERSASLDFDTGLFDVQKIMVDLKITSPAAQKMIWRILIEEGMSSDAAKATKAARKRVKDLVKRAGKGAEADTTLIELHQRGRLTSAAKPEVLELVESLCSKGIVSSPEWLAARGNPNQLGVVGEWLARENLPAAPGARVLRRVTVQGDLFEDATGTTPAKNNKGADRIKATVSETDLVYASETGGTYEVSSVINVKASGSKGMVASANQQNANFEAVLGAKPGAIIKIQDGETVRFARITSITALDGAATLDLTGKLKPAAAGLTIKTVGPKGASGFTNTFGQDMRTVSSVAEVLAEQQLIGTGEY